MSNIKSMYAIAKLKKNVKGFGLRAFKEDALQVYKETCQLLADGDQSRLRQVCILPRPFATTFCHNKRLCNMAIYQPNSCTGQYTFLYLYFANVETCCFGPSVVADRSNRNSTT